MAPEMADWPAHILIGGCYDERICKETAESKHVGPATCANGEPNIVPVAFKDVTSDGKLVVGDVFLDATLKNLAADGGKIAISIYDAKSLEGYQIKGTAEYVTEGDTVKTFKTMVEQMFNGGATAKGALIITPEKIIVTTPGADNKKEL